MIATPFGPINAASLANSENATETAMQRYLDGDNAPYYNGRRIADMSADELRCALIRSLRMVRR